MPLVRLAAYPTAVSSNALTPPAGKGYESFIGRGLLSQEELDAILLAAVDYREPEVENGGANER